MSIYRQNSKTGKAENTIGVKSGMIQRTWIHALAVMLFCMILSIGTVVFADEVPATVIVAGAKIRATADTSSEALAGVKSGDTLSICGQTTGTDGNVWYQVYVDANTKGFIRSDLIQKNTDGNITSVPNENANVDASTTTTNTSETQVTAVSQKTATVTTNGVRIRKGATTQHDVVATANRGMVLTVIGEAAGADGKTWYQVSFSYNNKEVTGFIRSDLVTFDNVPADTAVSEITGTEETPEETTTEMATEEATEPVTEEPTQEQEPEPQDENANIILMNVEEEVYVLPEFTPIILKWEDQDINAYKNGAFYIFYAQKQNGDTGWFMYDSENGVYQRYVYDTADATIPSGNALSANMFPIVLLFVVIIVLIIVIALMFLKLREYTSDYYDEYDEDEEDEEDDEEEFEEEELEEEEEPVQKPIRRPQQPNRPERPQQPQRRPERPQPQQGNGGQQPRRQPQPESGEQVRRPQQPRRQPQPENGQAPRRPQQQGNGQQPRRQPGEAQSKRPTQQQNRPNKGNQNQQLQNGRRAKNFLDADDDMEFIDI